MYDACPDNMRRTGILLLTQYKVYGNMEIVTNKLNLRGTKKMDISDKELREELESKKVDIDLDSKIRELVIPCSNEGWIVVEGAAATLKIEDESLDIFRIVSLGGALSENQVSAVFAESGVRICYTIAKETDDLEAVIKNTFAMAATRITTECGINGKVMKEMERQTVEHIRGVFGEKPTLEEMKFYVKSEGIH